MKPLIKVVLYLGLLILIVGICLYFYRSYEGFQSSGADNSESISFCDTNENKCDEKCINKSYEQGGLDPENLEEQPLYDLYDATNFEIISGTNTAPKTSVERYDMAAELGEFDIGAPVPWDYENRDQHLRENFSAVRTPQHLLKWTIILGKWHIVPTYFKRRYIHLRPR